MFWSGRKPHDPIVTSVDFSDNGELVFCTNATSSADGFHLQIPHEYIVCVRYHALEAGGTQVLLGVQLQTNLGRRSKFYFVKECNHTANATRFELHAGAHNRAICGFAFNANTQMFQVETCSAPSLHKKKLRQLLLAASVRKLVLQRSAKTHKSVAMQMLKGGKGSVAAKAVRHGLASKMFSVDEDGDALIRLLLEGEEKKKKSSLAAAQEEVVFPTSILRALTEGGAGEAHACSLLELMNAGSSQEPSILELIFGESGSIIKAFFNQASTGEGSLAKLLLRPDRVRGLRSIMQLLTDEEALDDARRPCILRSLLEGEARGGGGARPSLMRLMLLSGGKEGGESSIVELMLQGNGERESIARLLFTETEQAPISLCRSFFSDTAMGKPALAKYVFGGETANGGGSSLMRLMLQGEARQQASLLRLLGLEKNGNAALITLLTMHSPSSLIDILLLGENSASETSLARHMMGTTITIENGRVRMGNLLGEETTGGQGILPSVSSAGLPDPKSLRRGLTIAKLCMMGEQDGGPGISIMRMLLLGELNDGQSILRLLLTGEASGEVSPLRIIFTGMHAAFVGANTAMDEIKAEENLLELATHPKQWLSVLQNVAASVVESVSENQAENMSWKDSFDKLIKLGKGQALKQTSNWQKNLAFLYTAFARLRSLGPDFARVWKKRWLDVANEVRLTGERVTPESSTWKELAPDIASVVEEIAKQNWPAVFVGVAQLIKRLERVLNTSGNRQSLKGKMLESFAPKWF